MKRDTFSRLTVVSVCSSWTILTVESTNVTTSWWPSCRCSQVRWRNLTSCLYEKPYLYLISNDKKLFSSRVCFCPQVLSSQCLQDGLFCCPAAAPPNLSRGGFDRTDRGRRLFSPASETVRRNRRGTGSGSATGTMLCRSETCSQRTLESICATACCRPNSPSWMVRTF